MEWVKLATQFYNDPAFDDLTPNAERLFIRCLAFAGAVGSEGVLTQKQIKRVGILNATRYVPELVQAQLWVQTEQGDIRIRSWDTWQGSGDDLRRRREADRERKRREREMSRDRSRDVQPLEKTREEESITSNEVIHTINRPSGADRGTPTEPVPELLLFDTFWAAYPRKVGKPKAKAKYVAAVNRAGGEHTIVDGARRLAGDPNLPETRYIPHPTTWLERDGWEDEPLPDRGAGPAAQNRNLSLVDAARQFDHQSQSAFDVGFQMGELG